MKRIAALTLLVAGTSAMLLAQIHDAPEIDPGSIMSCSALIGAAFLLVRGRRKA